MEDVDCVFRALQHPRRRRTIDVVTAHQSLALPDLAELVLERETGDPAPALDAGRVRDAYFELYHTHVPVLCEADLCWYEQAADRIGATTDASDALTAARTSIDSLLSA